MSNNDELFQTLAIVSLETSDQRRKKFQSSFDQAFLEYVPKSIQEAAKKFTRLEELPFDPIARRRRVVATNGTNTYLIEIGSVETLLSLTHDPKANNYTQIIREDGAIGLRHLGIAYKKVTYTTPEAFDITKHETGDLQFVGFVALEDPLRPSAKHTVKLAGELGVAIKILSG